MPQTPNHGYNVPNQGDQNWHQPLNDNFEQYDTDIEIRDTDANKGDYQPKAGAKFLATDTEKVYVGDGSNWQHVPSTGREPTLSAINTGDGDLGVGTDSPATKLHVTDDAAKTGAMDLSRMAAVIENTSHAANGDVLGLKANVTNPGNNVDFLSFIGGSGQLGQLNGNGQTGIRLSSAGPLTLATQGMNLDLDEADGELVLDPRNNSLDVKAGVDGQIAFDRSDDIRIYGTDKGLAFRHGPTPRLYIDNDAVTLNTVDLEVANRATKAFVQSVDTPDGEKEVVYTSSEAPTVRTEVSGVAELEAGHAEIDLPDHFGWVTDPEEPIHVQTTPYSADAAGLAVTERSSDRLEVVDSDGEGDYEFSYTVRGTRDGHADKTVVREPRRSLPDESGAQAEDGSEETSAVSDD